MEYRLRTLEEDSKRNQATHKEFFERFEKLGEQHARIDAQYATIMATLVKLETAIEEIKSKPARRWDGIVEKVILGIVAALLGYVLIRLGLPV